MSFIFARRSFSKVTIYNEDDMEMISDSIEYLVRMPYTDPPVYTVSDKAYLYRGTHNGLYAVKYRNYENDAWVYEPISSKEALDLLIAADNDLINITVAEELFGPFQKA